MLVSANRGLSINFSATDKTVSFAEMSHHTYHQLPGQLPQRTDDPIYATHTMSQQGASYLC